jgi:nucleoside-triphosphatase
MGLAILLTGPPGCGKTTAILEILSRLECGAGGFYTQEIRESGRRTGFRLVTLDGREAVFAHVGLRTPKRVGKYGVDVAVIDTMGVDSILQAVREKDVAVVDEIGPMEVLSQGFRRAVLQALASDVILLGSIVQRSTPFTNAIKARPDVQVIQVRRTDREGIVERVVALIGESGACQGA